MTRLRAILRRPTNRHAIAFAVAASLFVSAMLALAAARKAGLPL